MKKKNILKKTELRAVTKISTCLPGKSNKQAKIKQV